MINKIILFLINIFYNNSFVIKIKTRKFKENNFNYDFINVSFENIVDLKRMLYSNKFFNLKRYDESSKEYHTFNWLFAAKKIGGAEVVTIAKKQIFNWNNKKYKINSFVWNINYVAKRLISLIYNFDFYAISSTAKEKKNI